MYKIIKGYSFNNFISKASGHRDETSLKFRSTGFRIKLKFKNGSF